MAAKKAVMCGKAKRSGESDVYFGVVKSFKQKLKECAQEKSGSTNPSVVYLWACVTRHGIQRGCDCGPSGEANLTAEQWLTVVDEAASLGANWLIFSLADPLSECGDIWAACQWAQRMHGMMVGLHLKTDKILRKDAKEIVKHLELSQTRVLVRQEALKAAAALEKDGIQVWTANPQPDGERPNCQGPTRMIFVTSQGVLYTCGLVEGKDAYRMGHVMDGSLKAIMSNPNLPHHVHEDLHYVTPECDGCPALIANYFIDRG